MKYVILHKEINTKDIQQTVRASEPPLAVCAAMTNKRLHVQNKLIIFSDVQSEHILHTQ